MCKYIIINNQCIAIKIMFDKLHAWIRYWYMYLFHLLYKRTDFYFKNSVVIKIICTIFAFLLCWCKIYQTRLNSCDNVSHSFWHMSPLHIFFVGWKASVLLWGGSQGGAVPVHHHESRERLEDVGQNQNLVPTHPRCAGYGCNSHWCCVWG